MATANEIAAKLAALGLGNVATSIFVGMLPASPDVAVAVIPYGGDPPAYGFGTPGIAYESPAVQLLFRGEPRDYSGPYGRAMTAYVELPKVEAQTLSAGTGGTSAFYHHIHPLQPPFELQRDGNERVLVVLNLSIEKELSA